MAKNKNIPQPYIPNNISYTIDESLDHAAEASRLVRSGNIAKLRNFINASVHKNKSCLFKNGSVESRHTREMMAK